MITKGPGSGTKGTGLFRLHSSFEEEEAWWKYGIYTMRTA